MCTTQFAPTTDINFQTRIYLPEFSGEGTNNQQHPFLEKLSHHTFTQLDSKEYVHSLLKPIGGLSLMKKGRKKGRKEEKGKE